MPLISVIVPVYDAASFLHRCIDSILAQQFLDFELILINDGSRDESLTICNSYIDKDSRVTVCNQSNKGASSARNHGIEIAKGKYICFVDADDYVNENYLSDLYQDIYNKKDVDLVLHGMVQIKGDKQVILSLPKCETYNLKNGFFFSDVNLFRFCGSYCKLFNSRILSEYSIRFNEKIICAEDFDFLAKYLSHCDNVCVSDKKNYYYVSNEGSLSKGIYSFESEYYALTELYGSLSTLYLKFQNNSLEHQFKDFMAYYVSRVLSSVYVHPRPAHSLRLNNLKGIDRHFVQLYRDYFVPSTINSKVLKFLFVNKLYWLFDIACMLSRKKHEILSKS